MSKKVNNHSNIIIGIVLVFLGLIFLANSFQVIHWSIWESLFRFWPLILIFFGLDILLKKSSLWWIIPVILVFVMIGLILYSTHNIKPFYGGWYFFNNSINNEKNNYDNNFHASRSFNENLKNLSVNINYGTGNLSIDGLDDTSKLYKLELNYYDFKPMVDYKINESGEGILTISHNNKGNLHMDNLIDNCLLSISKKIPINLNINNEAGNLELDLNKIQLRKLFINSGASDLNLLLGDYNSDIELNSGASRISLEVPSSVGLRIETTSVINSNNFEDLNLIKLYENIYQSKNYGEAEKKIKIEISASASKINLRY
jgi:hypothetical protein